MKKTITVERLISQNSLEFQTDNNKYNSFFITTYNIKCNIKIVSAHTKR